MQHAVNGAMSIDISSSNSLVGGMPHTNGFHATQIEELEHELPVVHDGQVPLGEVVSRTVQAIYAELSELAET